MFVYRYPGREGKKSFIKRNRGYIFRLGGKKAERLSHEVFNNILRVIELKFLFSLGSEKYIDAVIFK